MSWLIVKMASAIIVDGMAEKLGIGATFPKMTLDLVDGGSLNLPDSLDAKCRIVLFYRGHWRPYCRRQLVGFGKLKDEFDTIGAKVVAASVDPIDKAREVAADVSFPVGYGVTRKMADMLGAWWEDRRTIIQPSEFVVGADGNVIVSSYSDGPLGRIDGADAVVSERPMQSASDLRLGQWQAGFGMSFGASIFPWSASMLGMRMLPSPFASTRVIRMMRKDSPSWSE
jgi:peroxiredoxin